MRQKKLKIIQALLDQIENLQAGLEGAKQASQKGAQYLGTETSDFSKDEAEINELKQLYNSEVLGLMALNFTDCYPYWERKEFEL